MASPSTREGNTSSEGEELSSVSVGARRRRSRSQTGEARGEPDPDGGQFTFHEIGRMDTLAGLAIKYGVEVMDIKRANRLVSDTQMFAQKTLRIPIPGNHAPSRFASAQAARTGASTQSSRRSSPPPGLDVAELLEACTLLRQQSLPSSPDCDRPNSRSLPLSYASTYEPGRGGRERNRRGQEGESEEGHHRPRRQKNRARYADEPEEGREMSEMADLGRGRMAEEERGDWADGEGRWALKEDERGVDHETGNEFDRGKARGEGQGHERWRADGAKGGEALRQGKGKWEGASREGEVGWRRKARQGVQVPDRRGKEWEWRSLSLSPPEYSRREAKEATRGGEGGSHPLDAFSREEEGGSRFHLDDSPSPLSEGGEGNYKHRKRPSEENLGGKERSISVGRTRGEVVAAGRGGRVIREGGRVRDDLVDVREVAARGGRSSSRKLRSAQAEEVAAVVEQIAARAQKERSLLPAGSQAPTGRTRVAPGQSTARDDLLFAEKPLRRRSRGDVSSLSSRFSDRSDDDFMEGSSNRPPSVYSSTYLTSSMASLYSLLPFRALSAWYPVQPPAPATPPSNMPLLERYRAQPLGADDGSERAKSGLPPVSSSAASWSPAFPRATLPPTTQQGPNSAATRTASAKLDKTRPASGAAHSRAKTSYVLSSLASSPSHSPQQAPSPVVPSPSPTTTDSPSRTRGQSPAFIGLRQYYSDSSPDRRPSAYQKDDASAYQREVEDHEQAVIGGSSRGRSSAPSLASGSSASQLPPQRQARASWFGGSGTAVAREENAGGATRSGFGADRSAVRGGLVWGGTAEVPADPLLRGEEKDWLPGDAGRDERGDEKDTALTMSSVVRGGRGMSAKKRSSNKLAVE